VTPLGDSRDLSVADTDVPRDDRDIDRVLTLNVAEYGPASPRPSTDVVATRADFAWRSDQNPAGRAVIPVIRNAQGEVSGFIWLIPLRIRVKGSDYRAATGANLLIEPSSRGTLGFVKLLRRFDRALKDGDVPLHFSFVAEDTYQRLRAQDPSRAYTVPLLVKPLEVAKPLKLFVPMVFFRMSSRRPNADIRVEIVDRFDERFDRFWQQVRDRYPAAVVRDHAFLAWRFAPIGGRRYDILVARSKDRMLGYAVIRCARVRGRETGLILDMLLLDEAEGEEAGRCLVDHAERIFRQRGMWSMLSLAAPGTAEYKALIRSGCRNLTRFSPRPFRFAFFVHHAHEENLASLATKDWFVTFADFESL
jgi:hypothetical protein